MRYSGPSLLDVRDRKVEPIVQQTAAPSSPQTGDLWLDTDAAGNNGPYTVIAPSSNVGAALDTALAAGERNIWLDEGDHTLTGTWQPASVPDRLRIEGAGRIVLPTTLTAHPDLGYACGMVISGARTAVGSTGGGASLTAGSRTITWSGDHTATVLAKGRLALVSTDIFNGARPDQFKRGEWLYVDPDFTGTPAVSFAGGVTTIRLARPLQDTYTVATASLYRYTLPRDVHIGVRAVAAATSAVRQSVIVARYLRDPTFNVSIDGNLIAAHGIRIMECERPTGTIYAVDVSDTSISSGLEGYGLHLVSCERADLDVTGERCRHAFDVTGTGTRPLGRANHIEDGAGLRCWAAAGATHGGAIDTTIGRVVSDHSGGGFIHRGLGLQIGTLRVIGHHSDAGPYAGTQSTPAGLYCGEHGGQGMLATYTVAASGGQVTFGSPASWVAADVGRTVLLIGGGAGGIDHTSTIATVVSATVVTLAAAPQASATGNARVPYDGLAGTDVHIGVLDVDLASTASTTVHGVICDEDPNNMTLGPGRLKGWRGTGGKGVFSRAPKATRVSLHRNLIIDGSSSSDANMDHVRFAPAAAVGLGQISDLDLGCILDGVKQNGGAVFHIAGGPTLALLTDRVRVEGAVVKSLTSPGVDTTPFVRASGGHHGTYRVQQNDLRALLKANVATSTGSPSTLPVFDKFDNRCSDGPDSGPTIVVRKTADETLANSAVLQDDDHLFFDGLASTTYRVSGLIIYSGDVAGNNDVGAAFQLPTGASMNILIQGLAVGATGAVSSVNAATTTLSDTKIDLGTLGTTTKLSAIVDGLLTMGSTAGRFKFRWRQVTSNAVDATVYAGSFLSFTPVS